MRHLILGLPTLILLAAAALPAEACINDREVVRSEREFKSQYQQKPATTPTPAPSGTLENALPIAFLGMGGAMLLGATVTVLNLRKRPDGA